MSATIEAIRNRAAAAVLRLARRFGSVVTLYVGGESEQVYALIEPEIAETDPGGGGHERRMRVTIPRQEGLDFSAVPEIGARIGIGDVPYVVETIAGDIASLTDAATWVLLCRRLAAEDIDYDADR